MNHQERKFCIGTIATDKLYVTAQSSFFPSLKGRLKSKIDLNNGISLIPAFPDQMLKSGATYNYVCNVIRGGDVVATIHYGKCGNMTKDALRTVIRGENSLFYSPDYHDVFCNVLQSPILEFNNPQVQAIDIAFDTNEPICKKADNIFKGIENGELQYSGKKSYSKEKIKGANVWDFNNVTIYNKSKELLKMGKPYIRNFHIAAGLNPNTVSRVEAHYDRDSIRDIENAVKGFDIFQIPTDKVMSQLFKYRADKDLVFKINNGTKNSSRFSKIQLVNIDTEPLNFVKPTIPNGSEVSLRTMKIRIKNWFELYLNTFSSDTMSANIILSSIEEKVSLYHLSDWFSQNAPWWANEYNLPLSGMPTIPTLNFIQNPNPAIKE